MGYLVYAQRDPRWGNQPLGQGCNVSIGESGCYLCALAMGATALGFPITPDILNHLLVAHGLYVQGCEMTDDALARLATAIPGSTAWRSLPTVSGAAAQDPQNWHSQPGQFRILGLHWPDHDHFVTVVSWNGSQLLIGDPWLGAVVDFDQHYQRSQIFKVAATQGPILAGPVPQPQPSPAEQFVSAVKADLSRFGL